MAKHRPALPHGSIDEVFPNVFVVRGLFKLGLGMAFDRNMTVVRTGDRLVAINSVRLTDDGEAALAKLGKLEHVIRIGMAHGADDPYFVERFGATLWGPPGIKHAVAAKELTDADKPVDAEVFRFEHGKGSEAALVLPVDGGVLVTCDSYQNWTTFEHCSWAARQLMRPMGFGPTMIGGPWAKRMGPEVRKDFERLAERPFRHLIPGHGSVLRDDAKPKLGGAITARFA